MGEDTAALVETVREGIDCVVTDGRYAETHSRHRARANAAISALAQRLAEAEQRAEDGWKAYKSKNLYPITDLEMKLAESETRRRDAEARATRAEEALRDALHAYGDEMWHKDLERYRAALLPTEEPEHG